MATTRCNAICGHCIASHLNGALFQGHAKIKPSKGIALGRRLFWEPSSLRTSPARITSISFGKTSHDATNWVSWESFEKRGEEIWFAKCRLLEQTIYSTGSPHFVFQKCPAICAGQLLLDKVPCSRYIGNFFASALWLLELCSCNEFEVMPNSCVSVLNLHICFSLEEWLGTFVVTKSSWCIL